MAEERALTTYRSFESDHTALVHVLWAAQFEGIMPREVDADVLASHIMQSKWMRAVEQNVRGTDG